MSKIIAIDLGSTLSEVSVMEAGTPTIIVNDEGSRTTPSVVSFADGERKVGSAAKRQMVMKPKETVNLIRDLWVVHLMKYRKILSMCSIML